MTRHIFPLALLLVVSSIGIVMGRHQLEAIHLPRRSALADDDTADGWWGTLKLKSGRFCTLLNFPQPTLYGFSPVACPDSSYDFYWMWRIVKAAGKGSIASGDSVYLMSYNPTPKYCKLDNGVVGCGVSAAAATKFVIESEKTGAPAWTDGFRLKIGKKYCSLTGSGGSQRLKCDVKKPKSSVFQMPSSSFAYVRLVNALSKLPCGANPKPTSWPTGIVCSVSFFATNLMVSLESPGEPVVGAGSGLAFKTHSPTFSYYMTSWKMYNDQITDGDPEPKSAGQWFSLERLSGPATGGALSNSTQVALKSRATGKYCGISAVTQNAIKCDANGPLSALSSGYTYTYVANT